MKPGKFNIKFYRATTLDIVATYKIDGVAVDLSDYTADMQVRSAADSATVVIEFTTENGGLILNGVTGQVEIFMSAEDTAALDLGEFVYDLNIRSHAGWVTKILRGSFVVLDPVTE